MINKKLLSFDRKALRYVGLNVLFQWLGMLCNVVLVMTVSRLIGGVFAGSLTGNALWQGMLLCLLTVPVRYGLTLCASDMTGLPKMSSAPCAAASMQSSPGWGSVTARRWPPVKP